MKENAFIPLERGDFVSPRTPCDVADSFATAVNFADYKMTAPSPQPKYEGQNGGGVSSSLLLIDSVGIASFVCVVLWLALLGFEGSQMAAEAHVGLAVSPLACVRLCLVQLDASETPSNKT